MTKLEKYRKLYDLADKHDMCWFIGFLNDNAFEFRPISKRFDLRYDDSFFFGLYLNLFIKKSKALHQYEKYKELFERVYSDQLFGYVPK